MKITTLEKYIRYTDIPYTKLLARAEKGGLFVKYGETIKVWDSTNYVIRLFPYDKDNIDEGMAYINYNYPRN